ncbi:hypothetical protein U1Q18_009140 [Sarracenia purpurea var. burkii]
MRRQEGERDQSSEKCNNQETGDEIGDSNEGETEAHGRRSPISATTPVTRANQERFLHLATANCSDIALNNVDHEISMSLEEKIGQQCKSFPKGPNESTKTCSNQRRILTQRKKTQPRAKVISGIGSSNQKLHTRPEATSGEIPFEARARKWKKRARANLGVDSMINFEVGIKRPAEQGVEEVLPGDWGSKTTKKPRYEASPLEHETPIHTVVVDSQSHRESETNENTLLELPGAWEPPDNSTPSVSTVE